MIFHSNIINDFFRKELLACIYSILKEIEELKIKVKVNELELKAGITIEAEEKLLQELLMQ